MNVETAALTDTGRVRDHNEDSVLVAERAGGLLLAVADGMGGHSAGDVASELALDAFADAVADGFEENGGADDAGSVLKTAVTAANEAVRRNARENPEREGMGTTLVAAYVADGDATIVNVGDSRAYHVTAEVIEQVTVDQSMVQELVDEGVISPEEAADHPQRNVVSQALGASESVDPDVYDRALAGTLLLCSDGLTEEVPESEIHEVVAGGDGGTGDEDGADDGSGDEDGDDVAEALDAVAAELVARANEHGGSDNISVVLGRRSTSSSSSSFSASAAAE